MNTKKIFNKVKSVIWFALLTLTPTSKIFAISAYGPPCTFDNTCANEIYSQDGSVSTTAVTITKIVLLFAIPAIIIIGIIIYKSKHKK